MDHLEFQALGEKFFRLARLAQQLETQPRRFGTGEMFSGSEIRMIEILGRTSSRSVTGIAAALGVTKGAVSQTLKRLERRGLIEKKPDPANLSRYNVELTEPGRSVFHAHREWHETLDGGFLKYFESINETELVFLRNLLEQLEDFFIRRLNLEE